LGRRLTRHKGGKTCDKDSQETRFSMRGAGKSKIEEGKKVLGTNKVVGTWGTRGSKSKTAKICNPLWLNTFREAKKGHGHRKPRRQEGGMGTPFYPRLHQEKDAKNMS